MHLVDGDGRLSLALARSPFGIWVADLPNLLNATSLNCIGPTTQPTLFWWVFIFACVLGFFLIYGMVEDILRKWVGQGQASQKRRDQENNNS